MLRRLQKRRGYHSDRFRHRSATWATEAEAREMDVQFLMGHSGTAMVRRYAPTRNAEKAARAYARWSPDRFKLSAG